MEVDEIEGKKVNYITSLDQYFGNLKKEGGN
jgi:hypothetical protein